MSDASAIVNKLLEAPQRATNTRGLPLKVELEVRAIRDELQESANLIRALGPRSSLDERDLAVENLGGAAERLDNILLNYAWRDFPALDWVIKAFEGARDTLLEVLNQDDWAKPEDAAPVQQVVDTLTDLLK